MDLDDSVVGLNREKMQKVSDFRTRINFSLMDADKDQSLQLHEAVKYLHATRFDVSKAEDLYHNYQCNVNTYNLLQLNSKSQGQLLNAEMRTRKLEVLGTRDSSGALILLYTASRHAPKSHDCHTAMQLFFLILGQISDSHENQSRGITLILDMRDCPAHSFNETYANALFALLVNGYPIFVNMVYIVEAPSWFKSHQKLSSHITLQKQNKITHCTVSALPSYIPSSSIPQSLGGSFVTNMASFVPTSEALSHSLSPTHSSTAAVTPPPRKAKPMIRQSSEDNLIEKEQQPQQGSVNKMKELFTSSLKESQGGLNASGSKPPTANKPRPTLRTNGGTHAQPKNIIKSKPIPPPKLNHSVSHEPSNSVTTSKTGSPRPTKVPILPKARKPEMMTKSASIDEPQSVVAAKVKQKEDSKHKQSPLLSKKNKITGTTPSSAPATPTNAAKENDLKKVAKHLVPINLKSSSNTALLSDKALSPTSSSESKVLSSVDKPHSHPEKPHSHPDKSHSHPDKSHSHPDKSHSHPDKPHSYPDKSHSHTENKPHSHIDKPHSQSKQLSKKDQVLNPPPSYVPPSPPNTDEEQPPSKSKGRYVNVDVSQIVENASKDQTSKAAPYKVTSVLSEQNGTSFPAPSNTLKLREPITVTHETKEPPASETTTRKRPTCYENVLFTKETLREDEGDCFDGSSADDEVIYENFGPDEGNRWMTVDELDQYISRKGKQGISAEYFKLKNDPLSGTADTFRLSCNTSKNRYKDVVCYDSSRVKLNKIDNIEGSDYIHANYVNGFEKKQAYILTQGPLKRTVNDYWRMLWEKEVFVVVMTTKCVEMAKLKCAQYWPEEGKPVATFGNINVSILEYEMKGSFEFRKLSVHCDGVTRVLMHYQFIAWPDYGVPETGKHIIDLLYTARKTQESFAEYVEDPLKFPLYGPPLVIHCSAGIGRSGTFMALDYCVDELRAKGRVNVQHCVRLLRQQRAFAIQTDEQYLFCYNTVLEYGKYLKGVLKL